MPSSYLFINGLRFHYLHWNLEESGQPVVLLHGLGANARTWEPVAGRLAEAGLALLAPDLRGHGLTDSPDGDYGFAAYAADLGAFLAALDLSRPALIGHSWGALLALDYAGRFSFGPRAPAALVLVDGGLVQLDEAGAGWEETRRRLLPPLPAGLPLSSFLERLEEGLDGWKPDESVIPLILASYRIDEDEALTPRLSYENQMKIVQAMQEYQTHSAYRKVRCPVLALPAAPGPGLEQEDPLYWELKQRGAERLSQELKGARLHWLEAAAQDLPLERPDELARLILDFLRSLPAGA
jgi:pimeloyl-ACP methyl ester carboxylesterase